MQTGLYNEWYFDMDSKTCAPFIYSGCLGNGNRFLTKESCEGMCTPQEGTELCMKPKVEGSCYGNFTRYYYDKELGRCQECKYSTILIKKKIEKESAFGIFFPTLSSL